MAEPRDSSTILEDVASLIQQAYMTEWVDETPAMFGKTTNKLFKPAAKSVGGDGITMQYKYAQQDNVRFARDPLGSIASPKTFTPGTVKIRWNKNDLTAHDFNSVSASVQVDDVDRRLKGEGSIIDFAQELFSSIMGQFDNKLAIHRHLPRTGQVALVNGTPTLNNRLYVSGATGTATNAGGGRVAIDNGSIACFPAGTYIDFINPSTGAVRAGNIMVTDNNRADNSIGFAYIQDTTIIETGNVATMRSSGNLANVADNDIIVFSGEYGVGGMYSLGAYFATPAATGDSFFAKDRNDQRYRWLVPTTTRQGSTAASLTQSMFDDLSIAMGLTFEEEQGGYTWVMDLTMHNALRSLLGETAFREIPIDSPDRKKFMNFGTSGLNYQSPTFGMVKILADPLSPANVVRVINPETWRTYFYGWKGLEPFMASQGGGQWYRIPSTTPGEGLSKFWKADWYAAGMVDWCDRPFANGQIANVTV